MRFKIKLLKDPNGYCKHFLQPESPLHLHESWGFTFALLKWCIFYYVVIMASAYKAEPTSGAKLVKGVKEELKKCPRPEHLLQKLKCTRDLKESASRTQGSPLMIL